MAGTGSNLLEIRAGVAHETRDLSQIFPTQMAPVGGKNIVGAVMVETARCLPPEHTRAVRRDVNPIADRELMENIRYSHERGLGIEGSGIYQPVMVIEEGSNFRIRGGARRWRIATELGIPQIPAMVFAPGQAEAFESSLVENLLRDNMTTADVAYALRAWMQEMNLSLRELARRTGRSPSDLSRAFGVIDDEVLRRAVEDGDITPSEARELVIQEREQQAETIKVLKERRQENDPVSRTELRKGLKTDNPAKTIRSKELKPKKSRGESTPSPGASPPSPPPEGDISDESNDLSVLRRATLTDFQPTDKTAVLVALVTSLRNEISQLPAVVQRVAFQPNLDNETRETLQRDLVQIRDMIQEAIDAISVG